MANPAPAINQINAFNATQGTTIDFNIIGGTELVRSNRIYIYDLSDNSLICTHLYVSTESIHELPPNTDGSIVYESGKSSADFVNGAQYYAQIQTFTDIAGTEGGSGLSVAKMFWCLVDPTLTITTIPSTISTTSYNVSATYNANTSVVSNIIQQYQFSLYSATGSLLQSSGVVVGNGEQQGTSTIYDISYNFTGLSVGSSYYVVVDITTTQGMSVSVQSNTFTVSIDTPTLGEATVVNNACDGYISVTSNLSSEYGGSGSGEIVSFETDSENVFTKLQVTFNPTQSGSGTPSPSNVRPIYGVGGVDVEVAGKNLLDTSMIVRDLYGVHFENDESGVMTLQGTCTTTVSTTYLIGTTTNPLDTILKAGVEYYFSWSSLPAGTTAYSLVYLEILLEDGTTQTVTANSAFTLAKNGVAKYVRYSSQGTFAFTAGNTYNIKFYAQIEIGNQATEWTPYVDPTTVSQEFDVSLTPTSTDTDPYLFKAVGDVYGDRLEEDIVGGTVSWNQLASALDSTHWSSAVSGTTNVQFSNGVASFLGTVQYAGLSLVSDYRPPSLKDHKYFFSVTAKAESNANLQARSFGGYGDINFGVTTNWTTKTSIFNLPVGDLSLGNRAILLRDRRTSDWDTVSFKNVMLIDLTQMLGSTIADYIHSLEQANAGAGIAWLQKYFPDLFAYSPYNTGTLESVKPTAHVTRGVNQWDEEMEEGFFSTTNGSKIVNTNVLRSANIIPCLPSTTYYVKIPNACSFMWYDANKNYVGYQGTVQANHTLTTPSNVYYMNFGITKTNYGASAYDPTTKPICINISNADINGQYFPYESYTYPITELELRGMPKLVDGELRFDGDTRKADGTVTRNWKPNLVLDGSSDENWTYNSSDAECLYITCGVPDARIVYNGNTEVLCICDKFQPMSAVSVIANRQNYTIALISDKRVYLTVPISVASTVAGFRTWLSSNPITISYPLATPTTETTTPFEQYQVVSKYGTLEYTTTNNVPVGHNTTYYTRDIFGGYVDLVSGELVVDRKCISLPTSGWSANLISATNAFFQYTLSDAISVASNNDDQVRVISDALKGATSHDVIGALSGFYSIAIITNKRLFVYVPSATFPDVNSFMTWLQTQDIHIVYELATPLTYQLTPQQIQTLVGTNNVWSEQGDIELSYHIPITNLLVKRQDVDDVSGNWLTLYSQPVEQASDMDFTFIDFLNQYGKTYKYALVPLLTQQQSGVEVEVEGGYTVSDEVQSIFDGVFISDSTGSQKCKANVGYGNVNMNQSVGSITPIGSQYPIIVTNSNNRYHNGSISGMIVPDDYYYNGNLSRIDMVNKRNELEQFLTNKRAKIIKDWNSNIWLVMIMDNIDCSFDNNYGMGIVTFNANWLEIGDPTNQEDLQATGLVNVGGV